MAKRGGKTEPSSGGERKRRPGRPPIEGPTARQREILAFIHSASRTDRRPPSIDEIRRHFKFQSTYAVRVHLAALEKKGLLHIAKGSHRGLSLPGDDHARREGRLVPLLGDAPAGMPSEAIGQADEHIALDPALFPQTDMFAIRVLGDSMIGAGIHDRDVALIRPGSEAQDGDLVLVRLNNEVTIKRLRFENGKPALHPENPDYADIPVEEGDDFAIVGVIAGIVRKY
ncbi:MAG: transcriptional repressor LexA [Planctomycetota bacterium]|jgi:repressor LexA|nr:transcriptional repressor LexA [Planctomycetota bacterium]